MALLRRRGGRLRRAVRCARSRSRRSTRSARSATPRSTRRRATFVAPTSTRSRSAARLRRDASSRRILLDDPQATLPEYDLGPDGNAFRDEVRAWLAEHWAGERKAAFDAQDFHQREFDAVVRARSRHDRLARPRLAARVRRPGANADRAARLHGGDGARRGAADRRGRAGQRADDVRHARAAGALPPRDPARRGDARHGLQRARSRLRPGVAADERGPRVATTTATTGSSTARRSGRRRTGASTCSSRRAPTARRSRRTPGSACSSCRWTRPASRSSRRRRCTTAASPTSSTTTSAFRPMPWSGR